MPVMGNSTADDTEALLLAMDGSNSDNIDSTTVAAEVSAMGAESALISLRRRGNVDEMVTALALTRLEKQTLLECVRYLLSHGKKKNNLSSVLFSLSLSEVISTLLMNIGNALATATDYKRPEAETLRAAKAALEKSIKNLKQDGLHARKVIRHKFGENDELFALHEKCLYLVDNAVRYEICIFGQSKQGSVLLGTYEHHAYINIPKPEGGSSRKLRLYYTHGNRCLGTAEKQERTLVVDLVCSDQETRFAEVLEPEACAYTATITTPLACY